MKRITFATVPLLLACILALLPGMALAAETHMLAFGSDRHGAVTSIQDAMIGMPADVEYVGVLGDMVGGMSDPDNPQSVAEENNDTSQFVNGTHAPAFNSSMVRDEVLSVGFSNVTAGDIHILWADHDGGVTDDAGIVFADGGYGSGVMREGLNGDGSVAYYVYGIAYNEMLSARSGGGSEPTPAMVNAARDFEEWVDGIDPSVPIIVCCHVPLHYARGDNAGGVVWNDALNYAATGIKNPQAGCAIMRNVVFLYGHNHTIESKKDKSTGEIQYSGEYLVPCGSRMEVGASEGVWSPIYYTYTTAGYLNQNTAATLLAVEDAQVSLAKYRNGKVVNGFYDTKSRRSGAFASSFVTKGQNQIARVQQVTLDVPDGCSITFTDAAGGKRTLSGNDEAYLQMGKLSAKVSFDSEQFAVDTFTVTQGSTELEAPKTGPCTFSFTLPADGGVTIAITQKDRIPIDGAELSGIKSAYTYSGKAIKPAPTVTLGGAKLKAGTDYKVTYAKNTDAGTATLSVVGIDEYVGTVKQEFAIGKAKNTLVAKGKTVKVKAYKVKKKAQVLSRAKAMKVSKAKGKVTYKKLKGNKKITVNKKNGKVTVKKGLKRGTYKIKVRVTAAGTKNYKKLSKTITLKVKVA